MRRRRSKTRRPQRNKHCVKYARIIISIIDSRVWCCAHRRLFVRLQAKLDLKQSKRKDYYKILGVPRSASGNEWKIEIHKYFFSLFFLSLCVHLLFLNYRLQSMTSRKPIAAKRSSRIPTRPRRPTAPRPRNDSRYRDEIINIFVLFRNAWLFVACVLFVQDVGEAYGVLSDPAKKRKC